MYAFKIRKSDLSLLTRLNGGVTPEIEKQPTYLVVDATGDKPNEILTEKDLRAKYETAVTGLSVMKLKKARR